MPTDWKSLLEFGRKRGFLTCDEVLSILEDAGIEMVDESESKKREASSGGGQATPITNELLKERIDQLLATLTTDNA